MSLPGYGRTTFAWYDAALFCSFPCVLLPKHCTAASHTSHISMTHTGTGHMRTGHSGDTEGTGHTRTGHPGQAAHGCNGDMMRPHTAPPLPHRGVASPLCCSPFPFLLLPNVTNHTSGPRWSMSTGGPFLAMILIVDSYHFSGAIL
jgi:hypothetical protein